MILQVSTYNLSRT